MKIKNVLGRKSDLQKEICQEKLILDVTESIFEVLEKQGKSRADLAASMGRSAAYVSQLLNGSRNMTLRTLADISYALDIEPRFEIGFRDQLCDDQNWMSLFKPRAKLKKKPLYHGIFSSEQHLSGEWIDARIDERAA